MVVKSTTVCSCETVPSQASGERERNQSEVSDHQGTASFNISFNLIFFFFFFFFLGRHLWQVVEVPRLGVELELQLPAHTTATATPDSSRLCDLHHSSQQRLILNPLSKPRVGTYILMDAIWICNPLSHSRNSLPIAP